MVWSECKRYYDSKVNSVHPVTNDKVLTLWNEALEKVIYNNCMYFILTLRVILPLGYCRKMEKLF